MERLTLSEVASRYLLNERTVRNHTSPAIKQVKEIIKKATEQAQHTMGCRLGIPPLIKYFKTFKKNRVSLAFSKCTQVRKKFFSEYKSLNCKDAGYF